MLYTQPTPGVACTGAVIAIIGAYPSIAVDLAWIGSSAGGDVRKGTKIPQSNQKLLT